MTECTIPHAHFLPRSWGFTRKVPMGRHVKRAGRQKIAWFRKNLEALFRIVDQTKSNPVCAHKITIIEQSRIVRLQRPDPQLKIEPFSSNPYGDVS